MFLCSCQRHIIMFLCSCQHQRHNSTEMTKEYRVERNANGTLIES